VKLLAVDEVQHIDGAVLEAASAHSGGVVVIPITSINRFGAAADLETDGVWNTPLETPRPSNMQTFWTKERISEWLEGELHNMAVPSAYYGDEMGTYLRSDAEWDVSPFRVAAIGGSSYTGLAGNLGIPLVYTLVNKQNPAFICERSYFPMSRSDLERFEKRGVPIFTLETRRDIKEFDLCMFSGSYCGVDINIIKMLHMSGIPVDYNDRDERWPIIGRGGCHSFSPEPFFGIYDWFYIGDAEPHLSNVLRVQAEMLGAPKDEILYELATTTRFRDENNPSDMVKVNGTLTPKRGIPGIYVPKFYKELYHEQNTVSVFVDGELVDKSLEEGPDRSSVRTQWPTVAGRVIDYDSVPEGKDPELIPMEVDRVYIKDLNEEFLFSDQLVSYHDPGMSAGTLLISRGCNAKCSFCQEGMTWMPYRELSADKSAATLGDMMKQTGAINVLPSAFCASSYTQKKQLMKRTLEGYSDQIKLISQRVDEMAEDPNFVALTGFMGNDTCSLGVEGNSQRIRDMLNKNCTEEELLTATSHLLRAGYKKIKYFMIANIPGETHDDVMEVVDLAAKAAKLRDDIGSKCDIKFSWTPLVIQSFTPMQFCRPTLEQRSLSEVFPKLKELGVSFRLGSGAKYDEAYLMQLLHLGDRRIYPIIKSLVIDEGMVHYGSTPKGTKNKIEAELHDLFPNFQPNSFYNADQELETETIWDIFFHEKPYTELLSWDFVNVAVTKDYLWKRYLDFQNAVQTTKCDQLCDLCGVCDKFDHSLRHKLHENEDPEVDIPAIKVIKQRGNVQRIRFKIRTPADHRFVENEYWKFYVRRAMYQLETPVDKRSVQIASDTIPFRNHLFGTDYVDIRFFEMVDQEALLAHLRGSDLWNLWEVVDAKSYTSGMVQVRSLPTLNHYRMPFDGEEQDLVASRLQAALDAEELPVTLRSEGFAGIDKEEIDARPLIHDLWAERDGTSMVVNMVLKNRLSPYDMFAALFPQGYSRIFRIPAERVDSYLEVETNQEDFFRPTCGECGNPIEITLFDEPANDDLCLRCLAQTAGALIETH
jgi:radical SAM superfamily enzyme YgiQ (UPF0313 family)